MRSGPARRFWVDVRFLLGIGLIAASVLGGGAIVAAAERTETVYAAADALLVGQRVDRGDLVAVPVRLGATSDRYVRPADLPADGLVVTRPVDEGELVPRSAVGTEHAVEQSPIVLPIETEPASAVEPGALVDVWAARRTEDGGVEAPAVLVSRAQVVRTLEGDGLLAGSGGVEVLIPQDRVARVLQALGDGDALTVVPSGAGS
ncbi:MAG TPA: hypothetical protein VIL55_00460 [Naasia sp.]|jgi:hypothetical protein